MVISHTLLLFVRKRREEREKGNLRCTPARARSFVATGKIESIRILFFSFSLFLPLSPPDVHSYFSDLNWPDP